MEALKTTGETGGIPWMFPLSTVVPSMHEVETMGNLLRKLTMHILPCMLVLHQFPIWLAKEE